MIVEISGKLREELLRELKAFAESIGMDEREAIPLWIGRSMELLRIRNEKVVSDESTSLELP